MKLKVLLLVCLVKFAHSSNVQIKDDVDANNLKDEVWTWKCQDSVCKKTEVSEGERPIGINTCKLVCGSASVLWPRPSGTFNISSTLLRIDPHHIKYTPPKTEHTEAGEVFLGALESFSEIIRAKDKLGTASGKELEISFNVENPNVFRYVQGINESYHLHISTIDNKVSAQIISDNFLGARHGLETLSQLIIEDDPSGQVLTSSWVDIYDQPAYTHRGIALDTARNFVSVPYIKRVLDAMAYSKLNTFHWHITDSHSFPMESSSFPNLTRFGAYSKNKVYSEHDMKDLVRYAGIRGIRIVPEFDAPAHVGEGWQWAEGAVVCFKAEPWTDFCVEPPCGQLNPTAEIIYTVLEGIYKDMATIFHSDHFHMGGDEVNINCWNSSQQIVSEMEKQNIPRTEDGFHILWSRFQKRARDIAHQKFGSDVRPVLWTSTLTEGSHLSFLNSSDYIIQIWTKGDDTKIAHLVKNGFQVIMSNYDALYFDCGFGAWVGSGNNWCSPYIPWQKVYENDPATILNNLGVAPELHKLALGAEAALWTEQADDASIENRLWPRAAAMGEGLWSGPGKWQDAEHRLLVHRERLIERGILSDTLQPEWCSHYQGSCYLN